MYEHVPEPARPLAEARQGSRSIPVRSGGRVPVRIARGVQRAWCCHFFISHSSFQNEIVF